VLVNAAMPAVWWHAGPPIEWWMASNRGSGHCRSSWTPRWRRVMLLACSLGSSAALSPISRFPATAEVLADGQAIPHAPRPLVRRQAPSPWDLLLSKTGSYAHSMMDRYDPYEPEHLPGEQVVTKAKERVAASPVQGVQAASGVVFDCTHDLLGWEFGWSLAKKEWCCDHEHRGCESVAANMSAAITPDGPIIRPLPQHVNATVPESAQPEFHKVTGQEICEGLHFSEVACLEIGCCAFDAKAGICYSAISSNPCKSVNQASQQLPRKSRKDWLSFQPTQPQQQSPQEVMPPQTLQPQQQHHQQGWIPTSPGEWDWGHVHEAPADFPKEGALGAHASEPWVSVQYWWGPASQPAGPSESLKGNSHEEDLHHRHHSAGRSHFKWLHHSHGMSKNGRWHRQQLHHAENHAHHNRENRRESREKATTTKHIHEETGTTLQEAATTEEASATQHESWLVTTQQESTTTDKKHNEDTQQTLRSTTSIAGNSGRNQDDVQSLKGHSKPENPRENGSHGNNSHRPEADNSSHTGGSVPAFEHPITANTKKLDLGGTDDSNARKASSASSTSSHPVKSGSFGSKPVASEATQNNNNNEAGETEKEGKAKSAVQILIIVIACLIGATCIIGMVGLIYITFIKGSAEEDTMEGELVQNAEGEGVTEAGELTQPVQVSPEPRSSGIGF